MSAPQKEHAPLIKTPKQLIIVIILAFVVPILMIILLTVYVSNLTITGAGSTAMSEQATIERIKPVAQLEIHDASLPRTLKTGEQVYQMVCIACHATGVANAPKFGDKVAWSAHIALGVDHMLEMVLTGNGLMPPRAGTQAEDFSDFELKRALVYMANQAGGNFPEPMQPATVMANQPAKTINTKQAASTTPAKAAVPNSADIAKSLSALSTTPTAANGQTDAASNSAEAGKALYEKACAMCHASGLLNAPKFGDKAAWGPRINTGIETLHQAAIHGLNAMPPKGGSDASDDQVKAAVDYMVDAAVQQK